MSETIEVTREDLACIESLIKEGRDHIDEFHPADEPLNSAWFLARDLQGKD